VCVYAKFGGTPVGIVANQRVRTKSKTSGIQIGGVIYADAADKAARFVMDCNQTGLPIVFVQDVTGFMVGRDAEQNGIIRAGAKLVNAMSNSTVPKITVIVGGSFGAGNYAMCGRAFDPRFIFAWPNARFAVMGAEQASETLFSILSRAQSRKGKADSDNGDLDALKKQVRDNYAAQTDIRYAASRGWVDAIIQPEKTREVLIQSLKLVTRPPAKGARFHTGVLQV
jgi:3-methylcrotonyl-CoA carboxylase beta subunit